MTLEDIPPEVTRTLTCPRCRQQMIHTSTGWLCPIPGHTGVITDFEMGRRLVRGGLPPERVVEKIEGESFLTKWYLSLIKLAKNGWRVKEKPPEEEAVQSKKRKVLL